MAKEKEEQVKELKVSELDHKKLIYISNKLGEFEREKEIYITAYRTILDTFLTDNNLDKSKHWSFDTKTGIVKEYVEEKKDGVDSNLDNPSK